MNKRQQVKTFVGRKLTRFERNKENGSGKAELAALRRGVGRRPGELPELTGTFLNEMPEELMGHTDAPSSAEWAVYTALTLYALHQQGQNQPMHLEGQKLGTAIRYLMPSGMPEDNPPILARFNQMAASADIAEQAQHLRGIVTLLRANSIPLDYIDLADDLYRYQFEDNRNSLRLKWGRDFYRTPLNETDSKNNTEH